MNSTGYLRKSPVQRATCPFWPEILSVYFKEKQKSQLALILLTTTLNKINSVIGKTL